MLARAALLFILYILFAFPIYLLLVYLANARLTKEKATKFIKTTELVLIGASMASMALILILLAEKLL